MGDKASGSDSIFPISNPNPNPPAILTDSELFEQQQLATSCGKCRHNYFAAKTIQQFREISPF